MEHLKEIGTVVYINLPYETIEERIHNLGSRGISMAPGQTLKDVYDQRIPHYEEYADVSVDTGDLGAWESMELIKSVILELLEEGE